MKFVRLLLVLGCFCGLLCAAAGAQEQAQDSSAQKLERAKAILAADAANPQDAKKQETSSAWRSETEPNIGSAGAAMFKSLIVCVGIFLIGAAVYKKMYGRKPQFGQKRIQVLERGQLNHRNFLALVHVDGREVLVSYGADNITFLDLKNEADNSASQRAFEESLKEACVKKS